MPAAASDAILARLMALHPKVIDLVLDRVWRLLEALGDPQDRLPPVIHIAGTNGKGSTLAMIRAGLEAGGARAHAYTSPHLVRFHERIRLAGALIDEALLSDLLEECEAANGGAPITYFEITTCAALLAFARHPAEWCLLEVGLGGRLDATNVVASPALTVITPVAMDHEAFLGDTIAKIAAEKAGILKAGVPCIVAHQHPGALEVIEDRARDLGAPLIVAGRDFDCWAEPHAMVFRCDHGQVDLPPPLLGGPHQVDNAGVALQALLHLTGHGVIDERFVAIAGPAMQRVDWPARMQLLGQGWIRHRYPQARVYLDGGHNPAAGKALAETIRRLPRTAICGTGSTGTPIARRVHLVCGMLDTKDATGFLGPLAGIAASFTAVPVEDSDAAIPAAVLADTARSAGHAAGAAADVTSALDAITAEDAGAQVLICGSLYLAGEVLRLDAQ